MRPSRFQVYAAAAFLMAMVGVGVTIVGVVMASAIVTPALNAGTTLNGADSLSVVDHASGAFGGMGTGAGWGC